MNRIILIAGLILLFGAEIGRVYFIMPFPGSQYRNTISVAYWLANNIIWIRFLGLAMVIYSAIPVFRDAKKWKKIALAVVVVIYAVIFFFFNFRFEADKMFYQPKNKSFVNSSNDTTSKKRLVIGVAINGEAKAYPIEIIGYHHQVRDTVGNTPVMITYCTVCRTGRVFSPLVNGQPENFRLVGMDHFNAMFEDATTKSWWRQATGEAIKGPLTGLTLKEIPSSQASLQAWLRQYPNSLIMQPDSSFTKRYEGLKDYDNGTIEGSLEKRDSLSWKFKSWVVGVVHESQPKAYDWNELAEKRIIQDSIGKLPLLLVMESDTVSFHVYDRRVRDTTLFFANQTGADVLTDQQTGSIWNMDGICIEGILKGEKLATVQSYNEFWHSWQSFHPLTATYGK